MALTIKEQLDILSGAVIPNDSSYGITDLSTQIGFEKSQNFLAIAKEFDIAAYPKAFNYKSKLLIFISRFLEGGISIHSVNRMLVSLYADDPNSDFAVVSNTTTANWAAFISANMLQVVEHLAGILPEEKTEYNSI